MTKQVIRLLLRLCAVGAVGVALVLSVNHPLIGGLFVGGAIAWLVAKYLPE